MKQQELNFNEAARLRDIGIEQAVNHADAVVENWSEMAMSFLRGFLDTAGEFMTEEVRFAATGFVPNPPDERAWGSVIVRARKLGLIVKTGVKCKSDKCCHRGFGSVWKKS